MLSQAQHIVSFWFPSLVVPAEVRPVTTEGFSGARVFRVVQGARTYGLKCWPAGYCDQRLREIHGLQQHLAQCGLAFVPEPLTNLQGETAIEQAGQLWQLEPWMPGTANYWQQPNSARLNSAFAALASWHQAAATSPRTGEWLQRQSAAVAPTVLDRIAAIERYSSRSPSALEAGIVRETQTAWRELGQLLTVAFRDAQPRMLSELQEARRWLVDLQPVLRDVWHDHLLFDGDQVSGLIDYGATRTDTVAADLSRLLGSLVGYDATSTQSALAAYETVRPLSLPEQRLIPVLVRSNLLLSGLVWLRRRYVDGLSFPDESRVLERLRRVRDAIAGSP